MLGKTLRTIAVGYLYYPHVWLIRALGPRLAVLLTRFLAWTLWLTTLAGAQRRMRAVLTAMRPQFATDLSTRAIMRRYLETKLQNFAEWHGYPTRRGRRYVERTYGTIEGREHLEAAQAEGKGVILLYYHFGPLKMAFPALKAQGFDAAQHLFRGTTYAGSTFDWMAQAAVRRLEADDEASGLKHFYHQPMRSLITLVRYLGRGGLLGINADGMMGDSFVEVPFFDGTIELPTGPAQLAAHSGAPVVPMFVLLDGLYRHRLVLLEPIRVADRTEHSAREATAQFASILEKYVRRYPWAWWTWRRMRLEQKADGTRSFRVQSLAAERRRPERQAVVTVS